MDEFQFLVPVHVGDLVIMKASVNYAGRTSMEVGVRVETEDMVSGVRRHTNSAYLTFVSVDRNGRPMEVPELVPETPEQRRRGHDLRLWIAALIGWPVLLFFLFPSDSPLVELVGLRRHAAGAGHGADAG